MLAGKKETFREVQSDFSILINKKNKSKNNSGQKSSVTDLLGVGVKQAVCMVTVGPIT